MNIKIDDKYHLTPEDVKFLMNDEGFSKERVNSIIDKILACHDSILEDYTRILEEHKAIMTDYSALQLLLNLANKKILLNN